MFTWSFFGLLDMLSDISGKLAAISLHKWRWLHMSRILFVAKSLSDGNVHKQTIINVKFQFYLDQCSFSCNIWCCNIIVFYTLAETVYIFLNTSHGGSQFFIIIICLFTLSSIHILFNQVVRLLFSRSASCYSTAKLL